MTDEIGIRPERLSDGRGFARVGVAHITDHTGRRDVFGIHGVRHGEILVRWEGWWHGNVFTGRTLQERYEGPYVWNPQYTFTSIRIFEKEQDHEASPDQTITEEV